jgi:transposase
VTVTKKASSARAALFSCPHGGVSVSGGVMPRGVSANPGRAEKPREATQRLYEQNPRALRSSRAALAFIVTGGEGADSKQLVPLMEIALDIPPPKNLLADAGYDIDANRDELLIHGIRPVIKPNPTRKNVPDFDGEAYKARNKIKRMFNNLKKMRRIATRYDKTRLWFLGFIILASIQIWSPTFVNKT